MNILDHIQQNYPTLFESEKKIADFILANTAQVINMPIAVLAKHAKVSEASISRFCKKIQLTGFHQLKIELAKIQETRPAQLSEHSTLSDQLRTIAQTKADELNISTENLDEAQLVQVLKHLTDCRLVQFVAIGNTTPVAKDAAHRFNQLGITSVAFDDWQVQAAFTLNMTADDLLVVISNSGESTSLLKLIDVVKTKGIKVIAVTNHPESPISLVSDYHLTSFSRDAFFHKDYYFSRLSAMYLIELLFLILSQDHARLSRIKAHEDVISSDKI